MSKMIRGTFSVAVGVLMIFSVSAGSAAPTESVEAAFSCDATGSQEAKIRRASSLTRDAYSFERMGCAANLLSAVSRERADDLEAQIAAARALTRVLDYLRILGADDLMGVKLDVAEAIVTHAAQLEGAAGRAKAIAPNDARVILYSALAARGVDGAVDLKGLARAIETDPEAEGGLAQIVLGRSRYELPTFLGGDGQQAIELLEQARAVDASNPRVVRFLAEAYDLEGHEKKAHDVMQTLDKMEVRSGEEQRFADELRHAIALSKRLGSESRAEALRARRERVLSKNPELLTRAGHAVAGHGGPNPLTGK